MKRGVLSMVEVLCVAVLLLLFGLTTFTLVSVGADAYSRLLDKRESTSDMRIASSYLSMKVRQYDEEGAVEVREESAGDMLVLTVSDDDGQPYETRIYMHDGKLYEAIADPGDTFYPENGFEIVPVELFDVGVENGEITITLRRADVVRSFSLHMRSAVTG